MRGFVYTLKGELQSDSPFLLIKSTISLLHFSFFKSQSHKLDTFYTQEYIYLVASFSISLYLL